MGNMKVILLLKNCAGPVQAAEKGEQRNVADFQLIYLHPERILLNVFRFSRNKTN